MRALFVSIAPILHLTRVTTAFAAIANIWFVILWSRASAPHEVGAVTTSGAPTWALLLAGAVTAVGLFAFAAALNDTLDLRRDRVLHPLRPLPSGRLNFDAAVGLLVIALMVANLGATALGTGAVLMCIVTALAALFFHGAAKFVPSVGLVALSLIYGAHMMIPNVDLVFVWPVWLVMTHALLVGAVTHRLGQRRPALSAPAIVAATLGWAFWSSVLLYVGWSRAGTLWPEWVHPMAGIGPALLAALFVVFAWRKARVSGSGPRAAEKITRYGALWIALYDTAWLVGQGYVKAAFVLGGLTALGFAGMTVLRELYALIEHPLTYRR